MKHDQHEKDAEHSVTKAPVLPETTATAATAEIPIPQSVVEDIAGSPSSQLSATPPTDEAKGKSPSKGKNRCFTCNKKVGLTGIQTYICHTTCICVLHAQISQYEPRCSPS